jgi:shikimate kinase
MMNHRRPTYQRVATVTVDTAGRTPDEVVDHILPALEGASA